MTSVVIYTYFETPSSNYNLNFFCKKELKYRENIDYIIVINGFQYHPDIEIPTLNNLTVIKRENIGFDFGGHNAALEYIENNNKKYDFYFFMNSGVIGPILPHYFNKIHWTSVFIEKINDHVKLVGTSIACLPPRDYGGYGPKIEGFFFMTDHFGLELFKQQKTIFCNHNTFYDDIINGEYGLTRCIFSHGYTIDCMLRQYQNIDWRDEKNYNFNNNNHPSRKNKYYGISINPYEVIFHKCQWKDGPSVNFEIIKEYVNDNGEKRTKETFHR